MVSQIEKELAISSSDFCKDYNFFIEFLFQNGTSLQRDTAIPRKEKKNRNVNFF